VVEAVETTTRSPRVFLASRNHKKIEEMRRILEEAMVQARAGTEPGIEPGIDVVGLDEVEHYDEPVEDQPTFEGNALLKARAGLAATGLPTLADDSGLCVDALNGMPGVLSARWSGLPKDDRRNNLLLLDQLADVPDERRGAEFRCAVAFCHPDGAEHVTTGIMRGRVIRERRGTGGFGYDVVFVPDDQDGELTSAELTPEAKDRISHRGRSLHAMAPVVVDLLRS
jgi:XTP/dITP diphosphohydrolase